MAYEDFTTYVEFEEATNWFSVAANKIDGTAVDIDEHSYIYKDFGVNHFGDFTKHDMKVQFTSNPAGSLGRLVMLGQSNVVDNMSHDTDDCFYVHMDWRDSVSKTRFALFAAIAGVRTNDSWDGASLATPYYIRMSRSGTTVTLKIYTDSARTALVATLTITCKNENYRYIYAISSTDSSETPYTATGFVENLDLYEISGDVSAGIKVWDGTADIELVKDDTSPVKIETPGGTIGVKLVAIADGDASAIRFFDGVTTKAFKKKT